MVRRLFRGKNRNVDTLDLNNMGRKKRRWFGRSKPQVEEPVSGRAEPTMSDASYETPTNSTESAKKRTLTPLDVLAIPGLLAANTVSGAYKRFPKATIAAGILAASALANYFPNPNVHERIFSAYADETPAKIEIVSEKGQRSTEIVGVNAENKSFDVSGLADRVYGANIAEALFEDSMVPPIFRGDWTAKTFPKFEEQNYSFAGQGGIALQKLAENSESQPVLVAEKDFTPEKPTSQTANSVSVTPAVAETSTTFDFAKETIDGKLYCSADNWTYTAENMQALADAGCDFGFGKKMSYDGRSLTQLYRDAGLAEELVGKHNVLTTKYNIHLDDWLSVHDNEDGTREWRGTKKAPCPDDQAELKKGDTFRLLFQVDPETGYASQIKPTNKASEGKPCKEKPACENKALAPEAKIAEYDDPKEAYDVVPKDKQLEAVVGRYRNFNAKDCFMGLAATHYHSPQHLTSITDSQIFYRPEGDWHLYSVTHDDTGNFDMEFSLEENLQAIIAYDGKKTAHVDLDFDGFFDHTYTLDTKDLPTLAEREVALFTDLFREYSEPAKHVSQQSFDDPEFDAFFLESAQNELIETAKYLAENCLEETLQLEGFHTPAPVIDRSPKNTQRSQTDFDYETTMKHDLGHVSTPKEMFFIGGGFLKQDIENGGYKNGMREFLNDNSTKGGFVTARYEKLTEDTSLEAQATLTFTRDDIDTFQSGFNSPSFNDREGSVGLGANVEYVEKFAESDNNWFGAWKIGAGASWYNTPFVNQRTLNATAQVCGGKGNFNNDNFKICFGPFVDNAWTSAPGNFHSDYDLEAGVMVSADTTQFFGSRDQFRVDAGVNFAPWMTSLYSNAGYELDEGEFWNAQARAGYYTKKGSYWGVFGKVSDNDNRYDRRRGKGPRNAYSTFRAPKFGIEYGFAPRDQ